MNLSAETVADFNANGFVAIPGFLDEPEIAQLNSELSQFIQEVVPTLDKGIAFYEVLNDASSLKQIQKLFEHSDYFHSLMFGSPFEAVARQLLDTPVNGVNMQYFNKPPKISRPTPPHQDGYYFMLEPNEAVTMWLALDPSDSENGCVRYIPGSHRRGLRPHRKTETLGFSQEVESFSQKDRLAEVKMSALPGTLLVHHALTIHRAEANSSKNRQRRAIGFIYYSTLAVQSPATEQRQRQLLQELERKGKI